MPDGKEHFKPHAAVLGECKLNARHTPIRGTVVNVHALLQEIDS